MKCSRSRRLCKKGQKQKNGGKRTEVHHIRRVRKAKNEFSFFCIFFRCFFCLYNCIHIWCSLLYVFPTFLEGLGKCKRLFPNPSSSYFHTTFKLCAKGCLFSRILQCCVYFENAFAACYYCLLHTCRRHWHQKQLQTL